ncbi:hypothetical protein [Methylobacterium nigriterrae]|uniref:hypothetical protein n=1 Tax=Methylobacterium nigriterrae TaxID=3127512 RepID=UPI0030132EDF
MSQEQTKLQERAQANPLASLQGRDTAAIWAAILVERRALGERTDTAFARCGWPRINERQD